MHAPDPSPSLNVPAGHAVHGPPSGPSYPASQAQLMCSALPGGALVCAGHAEQLDAATAPALAN
eukprot:3625095-Rhodomonas_salina.1